MTNHDTRYQFAPVFRQANAAFNQRTLAKEFDYLVPFLKPGMKVIDCGCGSGSITLGIAEAVAPGQVIGIDQAEQAISKAREAAASQRLANLTFTVGDIHDLPFQEKH